MASPHGHLLWYELVTPEPAGARTFYAAVAGWDIAAEATGPAGTDYRMITRADGGNAGGVLGLSDEMQAHGARPMWLMYVGVDDVDAAVASVEGKGGKTWMPPYDIPQVGRAALVSDPQGAPFYVMKPTPPAGQPDAVSDVFSVDQPGRINWNELNTSDPAAALTFYGELFGWQSPDAMPMGDAGNYHFLDFDGQRIGALSGLMPGQSPHWRYYIGVAAVGPAIDAAKAAGGTIIMGPMEVPGPMFIAIGIDPQGAEFALVGKQ
jgi:uncharacterized protein